MELIKFIENLKEQFEEPVENFNKETKFKDLDQWSSLTTLSVMAMIDEEYNVALKGDDIWNANTVEDLFNTVKAKASEN